MTFIMPKNHFPIVTDIDMSKKFYFETWLESCSEQFCRIYNSCHNLNKHTKLSKVNTENSITTIIYNTKVIFSDYH